MAPLGYSGVPDLELAVAELAGNAIRHTETGKGGWFTLMLCQADDRLVIEVTDDGADGARPVMVIGPEPEFPEEGGRGLCLVDALAVRWGYWGNGSRTTVFAEFPHR